MNAANNRFEHTARVNDVRSAAQIPSSAGNPQDFRSIRRHFKLTENDGVDDEEFYSRA
jgi:hypothetical protein